MKKWYIFAGLFFALHGTMHAAESNQSQIFKAKANQAISAALERFPTWDGSIAFLQREYAASKDRLSRCTKFQCSLGEIKLLVRDIGIIVAALYLLGKGTEKGTQYLIAKAGGTRAPKYVQRPLETLEKIGQVVQVPGELSVLPLKKLYSMTQPGVAKMPVAGFVYQLGELNLLVEMIEKEDGKYFITFEDPLEGKKRHPLNLSGKHPSIKTRGHVYNVLFRPSPQDKVKFHTPDGFVDGEVSDNIPLLRFLMRGGPEEAFLNIEIGVKSNNKTYKIPVKDLTPIPKS